MPSGERGIRPARTAPLLPCFDGCDASVLSMLPSSRARASETLPADASRAATPAPPPQGFSDHGISASRRKRRPLRCQTTFGEVRRSCSQATVAGRQKGSPTFPLCVNSSGTGCSTGTGERARRPRTQGQRQDPTRFRALQSRTGNRSSILRVCRSTNTRSRRAASEPPCP